MRFDFLGGSLGSDPTGWFDVLKLPYGNANFETIRRNGLFYVDKTPFIPQLEDWTTSGPTLLFLRPRRFGKSLLVSMLEHYYDKARAGEFEDLFRGLWIHEHPTPEKNSYLVLRLDFSSVTEEGQGEQGLRRSFLDRLRRAIQSLVRRYPEIADFADILRRFDSMVGPAAVVNELVGALLGTEHRLCVLIDEYDTFATALLSADLKNVYEKVTDKIGFVRAFYRALKEGAQEGAIGRVFITGVTPILLDDMVTGFNVAKNISNRAEFNALAGFSKVDVERLLDEALTFRPNLPAARDDEERRRLVALLEEYYNGYRFSQKAQDRVFNPNMLIHFVSEWLATDEYPARMLDPNGRTDYKKLHSLWTVVGPAAEERRAVIETVLDTGHVEGDLLDSFGSKNETTTSQFISLMYYTGMLTLSTKPALGKESRFDVPNRVIREQSWEHYTSLLYDVEGIQLTDNPVGKACAAMVQRGDIEPMREVIRTRMLAVLSLRDLQHQSEKPLRLMLIGAMITSRICHVLTEKEFNHGYNDLFIAPLPSVPDAKYAWMLELKYVATKAENATIEKAFAAAEAQLRQYAADTNLVPMLTRGLALKMGTLVFVGHEEAQWREFVG